MKRLLLASALLALGACASASLYEPARSVSAAGYSEQMIEANRWRVRYTGTQRMSPSQVQDYALMRAAQLTLEHGGRTFEVVASNTDADQRDRSYLRTDYGSDYGFERSCGLLGCSTRAVPVMTRTETEVVDTRTIYEHSLEILIDQDGRSADNSGKIYNARDTFSTLKARLG